ncbi:MAG: hypothetical protein V9G20_10875 [Candidatus Promineifilaceae bacterium]
MSHHTDEKPLAAAAVAAQLNETNPGALTQIARIVERMGDENVAPAPGRFCTLTVPLCSSTNLLVMGRPKPVPS